MKKKYTMNMVRGSSLICIIFFIFIAAVSVSCAKKTSSEPDNSSASFHADRAATLIVGFSQIGTESARRTAHTRSILSAAEKAGIQIIFSNAEQQQKNQIHALRSFIAYQVDVIVFVPIVQTGWDEVLREAKEARIPVLVIDRNIQTADESLYAGFIGTDDVETGRKAARFLIQKMRGRSGTVRVAEMSGTAGSSAAAGRSAGFAEVMAAHNASGIEPHFSVVQNSPGDFLRSKGKEVMHDILNSKAGFDAVFSHNDSMTLGALDAIAEQQKNDNKPLYTGQRFVIISVDGEQAAVDELSKGRISCIVECSPYMGTQVMEYAALLAAGKSVPRVLHIPQTVFTERDELSNLPARGY